MNVAFASSTSERFERDGWCIVPEIFRPAQLSVMLAMLEGGTFKHSRRGDATYGARNLLADEGVQKIAQSCEIVDVACRLAAVPVRAVRGLFFDKTPEANWLVPWHQDLMLALAARHAVAGWGPWSIKAGVHHAEAPADFLARMVTLRLHLDDCGADNGPLRVLPGSHRRGRLRQGDIKKLRDDIGEQACIACAGDALVIRPLLVHASSPAKSPCHRRVLHLEFAPEGLLPPPLAWAN